MILPIVSRHKHNNNKSFINIMHTSSIVALLVVAFVAIVLAQPACPPPTPVSQFTVNFMETVKVKGAMARYPNTMIYSGSTLQQNYESRTQQGVLESVFIVNATLSNPNNNGKFWIIDMDQFGNPEACTWNYINEMSDPIDINPPLIPYLDWTTCNYVGTNKIAGQQVYQYHMTNPKSFMAMEYYINTQTLDPVRYTTIITSKFYNVTQINDYQKFDYTNPDPKSFWMPANTPGCVAGNAAVMKQKWEQKIVRKF